MKNIVVEGPWSEGIVLDYHVSSSMPLGFNEYGHMEFETVRTQLGEIIYKIKYKGFVLNNIGFIELIKEDLDNYLRDKEISYIIGAPPSNRFRYNQPVDMIGDAISEYINVPYIRDLFLKTDRTYSKDMIGNEKEQIVKHISYNEGVYSLIRENSNILLIDDIYQTGSTLRACTQIMLDLSRIDNIFVLALTKTRN